MIDVRLHQGQLVCRVGKTKAGGSQESGSGG